MFCEIELVHKWQFGSIAHFLVQGVPIRPFSSYKNETRDTGCDHVSGFSSDVLCF